MGTSAWRSTERATLPMSTSSNPVRPWVAMAMEIDRRLGGGGDDLPRRGAEPHPHRDRVAPGLQGLHRRRQLGEELLAQQRPRRGRPVGLDPRGEVEDVGTKGLGLAPAHVEGLGGGAGETGEGLGDPEQDDLVASGVHEGAHGREDRPGEGGAVEGHENAGCGHGQLLWPGARHHAPCEA